MSAVGRQQNFCFTSCQQRNTVGAGWETRASLDETLHHLCQTLQHEYSQPICYTNRADRNAENNHAENIYHL